MEYNKLVILLLAGLLFANMDEYISKIDVYITKGELQDAADLFDKSLLEYDANAKLYFMGAHISIKMDDLDQANKYFVKAIELDTKNEEYRDAQKNLAGYPRHTRTLRELKQTLAAELKKFPRRPYGEFVTGGNATPGGGYDEVFETLRKAAGVKKK